MSNFLSAWVLGDSALSRLYQVTYSKRCATYPILVCVGDRRPGPLQRQSPVFLAHQWDFLTTMPVADREHYPEPFPLRPMTGARRTSVLGLHSCVYFPSFCTHISFPIERRTGAFHAESSPLPTYRNIWSK